MCYSNHASLTELEQFIRHFAPLQITPCAIPPNSSKEEVRDILASFLSDEDSLVMSSSCPREDEAEVRSSSSLSSGSRKRKLSSCGSLNFSESNSFEEKQTLETKSLKLINNPLLNFSLFLDMRYSLVGALSLLKSASPRRKKDSQSC